jgi:hypothetical protein
MGASSSFANNLDNTMLLFISFPDQNIFIDQLQTKFNNINYSFIDSNLTKKSIMENSVFYVNNNIKYIIENISKFIICISNNTFFSISQNMEFNSIFYNTSNYNKKIIYLILDKELLPFNDSNSKCIIGEEKWYPFYDNLTATLSIDFIINHFINEN